MGLEETNVVVRVNLPKPHNLFFTHSPLIQKTADIALYMHTQTHIQRLIDTSHTFSGTKKKKKKKKKLKARTNISDSEMFNESFDTRALKRNDY